MQKELAERRRARRIRRIAGYMWQTLCAVFTAYVFLLMMWVLMVSACTQEYSVAECKANTLTDVVLYPIGVGMHLYNNAHTYVAQ